MLHWQVFIKFERVIRNPQPNTSTHLFELRVN